MEKKHIKYFQKQPELAAITFFKKLSWKTRALHLFSVTTTENIFFEIFKSVFGQIYYPFRLPLFLTLNTHPKTDLEPVTLFYTEILLKVLTVMKYISGR